MAYIYFKNLIVNITFILVHLLCVNGIANEESGNDGRNGGALSTVQTIAISAVAVSAFVLCSICTWTWWRRLLCGRGNEEPDIRPDYHPEIPSWHRPRRSFEPLDPNNLPRIEPLPTLQDLQMQSINVPTIATISGTDADVHAQDWFEDSTRRNFPRANVEYVQELGRGWFGKVIEAHVRNISPMFQSVRAVIQEQREDSDNRDQMKFLHNARFYRDMNHENILKLLGYCIERPPYMLIYENWPLGDLKHYLITNAGNGETMQNQGTLVRMAIDIAKGLDYMHQSGYVHGDLAARNCMVGNTAGKVVIGDYGLGPQMYRDDYHWDGLNAWPIRWAAPETMHCTIGSIQGVKTTAMSNVWTFGIVLWEIFEFGKMPYPQLTNEGVLDQVVIGQSYILEPLRTPFLPINIRETLYTLMLTCWTVDPENRPPLSNILETLTQP